MDQPGQRARRCRQSFTRTGEASRRRDDLLSDGLRVRAFPVSRWLLRWSVLACIGGALPAACSSENASSGGGPDAAGAGGQDSSLLDGPSVPLDSGLAEASSPGPGDAGSTDASDAIAQDASDGSDCAVGSAGEPIDLRCTGLYSDFASKTVSADLQEYDPGLRLWSDGAVKTRWIYLPPGTGPDAAAHQPIDTSDMDEWTFPVGTKIWKEFVLEGRRIETRLLWKQAASSWYLTTYLWSPDESTATELTAGELDADGHGYEVPTQAACPFCHRGRRDDVLGFEAVSLSSANATPVTMQTLVAQGWITNAPEAGIVIPGNPTDVAALGYLHANCGTTCHNRNETAFCNFSGLFFRLGYDDVSNPSLAVADLDAFKTAVNIPAPAAGPGFMRIAPGDPAHSGIAYLMSRRVSGDGGGLQMPLIDTHVVDQDGVAMVTAWIQALGAN
jgi:hypothetical protein